MTKSYGPPMRLEADTEIRLKKLKVKRKFKSMDATLREVVDVYERVKL